MIEERLLKADYLIHGIPLRVSSNSRSLLDSVERLMFPFRVSSAGDSADRMVFCLMATDRREAIPISVPPGSKIVYRSSENDAFDLQKLYGLNLTSHYSEGIIYWDFGRNGLVACNPWRGEARGFLVGMEGGPESLVSHWFFLLSLNDLLRARGLFPIHAATVSQGGLGVVIAGLSGSGKTTCCIALVLGGFDFLSDDRSFLRRAGYGSEVLSFPEGVDVTDATVSIFPELRPQLEAPKGRKALKRSFLMNSLRPGSLVDRCVPRLLLFPSVVPEAQSELEPVSKAWAFRQLLPHSLLVFDPRVAALHFDSLALLVDSTDSYRLTCGKDIRSLPELVREVL